MRTQLHVKCQTRTEAAQCSRFTLEEPILDIWYRPLFTEGGFFAIIKSHNRHMHGEGEWLATDVPSNSNDWDTRRMLQVPKLFDKTFEKIAAKIYIFYTAVFNHWAAFWTQIKECPFKVILLQGMLVFPRCISFPVNMDWLICTCHC